VRSESRLDRLGGPVVVFGVLGLLLGLAAVPFVWGAVTAPGGTVAVVEVHGTITTDSATPVIDALRDARRNDSVEAVVLDINSPGGSAAASEQLYLAVKRTAGTMPVVASVTGTAASGGYYTAAPADRMYVSPASAVGSVGVRAVVPPEGEPAGEITSGPDKATTATEAEIRRRVEALQRAFVGAVFTERNNSITLTREQLGNAKLYSGARGVELGLADRIGGIDTAIDRAASQADLDDYRVERRVTAQPSAIPGLGLDAGGQTAGTEATFDYRGVDTTQYLMLHGQIEEPEPDSPTVGTTREVSTDD
jgi:protease-4